MDYQQQGARTGYEFAVLNARIDAARGFDIQLWLGQMIGLAVWAKAAPEWEDDGIRNELNFLRGDYALRHSA